MFKRELLVQMFVFCLIFYLMRSAVKNFDYKRKKSLKADKIAESGWMIVSEGRAVVDHRGG